MSRPEHIRPAMSASTRSCSTSSTPKPGLGRDVSTMSSVKDLKRFEACAATASKFLYAFGSSVLCCCHDSLDVERRFSGHKADVKLVAVDNHSEAGAGRLVVSYDCEKTAIVWDLMTGDEITQFCSYDEFTVATWMRNGNIAFGNTQGSIILFEPTTSEHISWRTLDQIAITALAPSSDCRTFAIGYQNGSLLIASLEPRFTILHNLTTSRGPSPIVTLAWHASASRQKAEMLAVQTHDGDLRVWSVAKSYKADDAAKVVRILRMRENYVAGPNWMGWSKNGRVIQYSDSETLSWDVRSKHVTCDPIPTLEHVRGMAVYGPGALLFTLGANNTVQQFDLNSPSIMVANVQHLAAHLPPSPPNSIEGPGKDMMSSSSSQAASACADGGVAVSDMDATSIPVDLSVSESDEENLSPFARFARRQGPDSINEPACDVASPVSSRSALSTLSRSSASSRTPGRPHGSTRSHGITDATYISAGSSLKASTAGRRDVDESSVGHSFGSRSVLSMASSSRRMHGPSKLKNEVPRSPEDNRVHDLFIFTRARVSDMKYKHSQTTNSGRLTNDDLRRQMLSTIFGWHEDVEDLVQDEMNRHPPGSANRVLLAKWLGDLDADIMTGSSENMTSSDWMLLALSGIGGQKSQHSLGRAYVQRLLESGDVHAAVTIMLGMGDHNDAIEVYTSHKRFMEALILTCLTFPSVWERQAAIIRKWGEKAVQQGQQQLAIRCFACTDKESTEPWASPSAAHLTFQSIPEVLSPPLSPPGVQRGPQRCVAKSSALRLITAFGDGGQKSRFYSNGDGGQTPIAAGITPIADSAISPAGTPSGEITTAFVRPCSKSRFNTPTSARPGSARGRLPSIGENGPDLQRGAKQDKEAAKSQGRMTPSSEGRRHGAALQRAATASPLMIRDGVKRIVMTGHQGESPPSPDAKVLVKLQEANCNHRNGSRGRIPRGVNLQVQTDELAAATAESPCGGEHEQEQAHEQERDQEHEQSGSSASRPHWPNRRRGPASVASSVTSGSSAGRSLRTAPTPRYRDDYIHSLDTAQQYGSAKSRSRPSSKERRDGSRGDGSRGRRGSRERKAKPVPARQEERGRSCGRSWGAKTKRSPTSPIPMSPEDLANLSTAHKTGRTKLLAASNCRPPSPDGGRGRTATAAYRVRSPSSPLPLPPPAPQGSSPWTQHHAASDDEEDYKKAMMAQQEFRYRHGRSTSRGVTSPVKREGSERDRPQRDASERDRPQRDASEAAETPETTTTTTTTTTLAALHVRAASTDHAGDLRQMKDERVRKREQAARELEQRRQSLAQRALAPAVIPHPSQISSSGNDAREAHANQHDANNAHANYAHPSHPHLNSMPPPPRSATEPPRASHARLGPPIGLPATPKAMRVMLEPDNNSSNSSHDDMPPIPLTFSQRHSPNSSPDKDKACLTLLPSTVYQPPASSRPPIIPRSMSAPIPHDSSLGMRSVVRGGGGGGGELGSIDESASGGGGRRRRSSHYHEDPLPPQLKELQHLAVPPPPPPAPLPYVRSSRAAASLSQGAVGCGLIEIVMDKDRVSDAGAGDNEQMQVPPNDGMVPILAPPAPSRLGRPHVRGASGDVGMPARVVYAKPPPAEWRSLGVIRGVMTSPTDGKMQQPPMFDAHAATGLHHSEMI